MVTFNLISIILVLGKTQLTCLKVLEFFVSAAAWTLLTQSVSTFLRIYLLFSFSRQHQFCSVIVGFYSFRSCRGSVFILELCEMLRQYSSTLDLLHILTRVNYEVAYSFESRVNPQIPGHELLSRKKQMPSITSMLTKYLYFVPKQSLKNVQCSTSRWKCVKWICHGRKIWEWWLWKKVEIKSKHVAKLCKGEERWQRNMTVECKSWN